MLPYSTDESLAEIPENPTLRTVSICHNTVSAYDARLMKLLIMKMPNLDSLEIRSTPFVSDPVLDAIFAGAERENGFVKFARFDKEQLAAIRAKFTVVGDCFSSKQRGTLNLLFAPRMQVQQQASGAVLALDAPAAAKQ